MTRLIELLSKRLPKSWRDVVSANNRLHGLAFIVFLLIFTGLLLDATQQGRDLLADGNEGTRGFGTIFGAVWLGVEAWFWGRFLIDRATPEIGTLRTTPNNTLRWTAVWTPRVFGALPFAFIIGAVFLSRSYVATFCELAVATAITGLVFVFGLVLRTRVIGFVGFASKEGLKVTANRFAIGGVVASIVMLVVFIFCRVALPQALGSVGVTFIGLALIISTIEGLLFYSRLSRLPVLGFVLILACVMSVFFEDHDVGARWFVRQKSGPTTMTGLSVKDAFAEWKLANPQTKSGEPIPIVFISIEGGASRSGAWAARVLSKLQETDPRFAKQIFSISSVSGGSLGAVAYLSALHQYNCDPRSDHPFRCTKIMEQVTATDFLSPAVGAFLFPDLIQRFIGPGLLPDRAQALEEAFEAGWRKHSRSTTSDKNLWAQPFPTLWSNGAWQPILVINGMREEDGARILTSNLAITPDVFPNAVDFRDVADREPAISTAITNGARFPLVSPAGTLRKGGHTFGHIVDGGYFDNGGVVTTLDIARKVQALANNKLSLRPIFIQINNDAVEDLVPQPQNDTPDCKSVKNLLACQIAKKDRWRRKSERCWPKPFLPDLLGAPMGLLGSRRGHDAFFAKAVLQPAYNLTLEPHGWGVDAKPGYEPFVATFNLCRQVAMDWVISASGRREIWRDALSNCGNSDVMKKVLDAVTEPPTGYDGAHSSSTH